MSAPGFVSLVGAGPGVRDHLTLRAVDRLKRADLVLYDALVDPSLLDLAASAQRFYVGKRAGRHAMSQATIEALLVKHAREGKRVVRLKAGDPFILGRGGEEALALEAAGVPYEIVPGLSSALGAPAFAGIPLTHRGLGSAFFVLSGHAEDAYGPVVDSLPPGSGTLVFLMGYAQRRAIATRMMAAGWEKETPAALVAGAGTHQQKVWVGTLGALSALAAAGAEPSAGSKTKETGRSAGPSRGDSEIEAPREPMDRSTASPSAPPSVAAPSVAAPSFAAPSVAAPSVAAPSVASPSVAAPTIAAPDVASPSVASPSIAPSAFDPEGAPVTLVIGPTVGLAGQIAPPRPVDEGHPGVLAWSIDPVPTDAALPGAGAAATSAALPSISISERRVLP